MLIYLTALLMYVAISSTLWFLMTYWQEKEAMEKRIAQIVREKYEIASAEMDPGSTPTQSTSIFFEKKLSQARQKRLALFFIVMISLPIAFVWYVSQPTVFLFKWLVSAVLLWAVQRFVKARRERLYRVRIEEELPRGLDLLIVCVEGGMSINSALIRVAEEGKNTPLSKEFRHTFHELNAGLPLEQAFKNLGERLNIPDLQALATSIIQSERLGMSLSDTLRNQARILREDIRMRTREKIMKIPVKIMVPIALFIVPAVFIMVLGPAAIEIKRTLMPDKAAHENSKTSR